MADIYSSFHIQDVAIEEIIEASPIAVIDEALHLTAINEAYEKGYQQGLAEGQKNTEESMNKEFENYRQPLQALLQSIPFQLSQQRSQLNDEIAFIVMRICEQLVLLRQLDKTWLFEQINAMLEQLNDDQRIELSIHPTDLDRLQKGDFKLSTGSINGLSIRPDELLSLGGCSLKTEQGRFELNISKQIDKLKILLLKIQQGEPID